MEIFFTVSPPSFDDANDNDINDMIQYNLVSMEPFHCIDFDLIESDKLSSFIVYFISATRVVLD
ncbi:unnamed protein product [Cunninghamella blakesleeana]